MAGDRWTFLVMRGEDDPVQQYTLSTQTLKWMAGAGAFAAVLVVAGALVLGAFSLQRMEARSLEARNEVLEEELERFQGRMAELESTLDRVAANDAHFRSIAGLEVIGTVGAARMVTTTATTTR